MNLSAALLVKRSAAQLNRYYRKTPPKAIETRVLLDPFQVEPSADQLEGNKQARAKAISPYLEMLGIFTHRDINIYFTIDEIVKKSGRYYLIEHKWLKDKDNTEEWFFTQSIIQTAFLNALAFYSKDFKTASFYEGPKQELIIPNRYYSHLQFGDTTYRVKSDPLQVMRFYLTKARTVRNYERAIRFDVAYKHKELSYLNQYIEYSKTKANYRV